MKKTIFILTLSVFSFLFSLVYSQTRTISDTVYFYTRHQSLWGPDGPVYNLDQEWTLFDLGMDTTLNLGSISNGFGSTIQIHGNFGVSAVFGITGFTLGEVNIDYPVKIDLTFPENYTFNPGQWITIQSDYDTLPGWKLDADFPKFGKVYLTFDFEFDFDLDQINCLGPLGCDTNSILDFHVPLMHDTILYLDSSGYVVYPCINPSSGQFGFCSGQLLPITFHFPVIGLSGAVTLPYIYTDDYYSNSCLIAQGDCTWVTLNVDVIELLASIATLIPPPTGQTIHEILTHLNGQFVIDTTISNQLHVVVVVDYHLLEMDFSIKSTMQQDIYFCPTIWTELSFPTEVEYYITDPLNDDVTIEAGISDTIKFAAGHNLNFKYPCFGYPEFDIGIRHFITSGFRHHVWDSLSFDFIITVFQIDISLLIELDIFIMPVTLVDETYTIGPLYHNVFPLGYIPITWMNKSWNLGGFRDSIFPPQKIIPNPHFQAYITDSGILCGDTAIAVWVQNGTPPYTYVWSTGDSTVTNLTYDSLIVDEIGTYFCTVTDASGCQYVLQCEVLGFAPALYVSLTHTDVLCHGDSTGSATANVWGGTGSYTYYWSPPGDSSQTIYNLPAGTYYFTASDEAGCIKKDSVVISQPDSALKIYYSYIEHVKCYGWNNAEIDITITGGTPDYNYLWNNGQTTQDLHNLYAGNYIIEVTDANNCKLKDSIEITQPEKLRFYVHNRRICYGQTVTLTIDSAFGGTLPYYFIWSTGATNDSIVVQPFTDTDYWVYQTDSNNCPGDTHFIHVTVTPQLNMELTISRDTICYGDSIIIDAIITGGGQPPYTVTLNDGTIGIPPFVLYPQNDFTYIAQVSDSCNFATVFDTVKVKVMPLPPLNITHTQAQGCVPLTVDFYNTWSYPGQQFIWYIDNHIFNTETNSHLQYTFTKPGNYTILVTSETIHGCKNSDTLTSEVIAFGQPTADFTASQYVIELADNPDGFVQFYDQSEGAVFWMWNLGDSSDYIYSSNPFYYYKEEGSYYVTLIVVSQYGCSDTITKKIEVIDNILTFPNIITPNGDGYNDFLVFENLEKYPENKLIIFNRWGNKLVEMNGYQNKWDANGVPEGTYFYILEYKHNGEKKHYEGSFCILR